MDDQFCGPKRQRVGNEDGRDPGPAAEEGDQTGQGMAGEKRVQGVKVVGSAGGITYDNLCLKRLEREQNIGSWDCL